MLRSRKVLKFFEELIVYNELYRTSSELTEHLRRKLDDVNENRLLLEQTLR